MSNLTHFDLDLPALLDTAGARLRKQSRYSRPLTKGGKRAAAMEEMLAKGRDCILELSSPAAVLMPVSIQATEDGMRVGENVDISGDDFRKDAENAVETSLYLMTLGYDQQVAFKWLENDYVIHHMHSDLATEVLFAIGRQVFNSQKDALDEGRRLKRVSIQTYDVCGQKSVWDVEKVQAMMGLFGTDNQGVTVTDTGCFLPLYSILGMTIEY